MIRIGLLCGLIRVSLPCRLLCNRLFGLRLLRLFLVWQVRARPDDAPLGVQVLDLDVRRHQAFHAPLDAHGQAVALGPDDDAAHRVAVAMEDDAAADGGRRAVGARDPLHRLDGLGRGLLFFRLTRRHRLRQGQVGAPGTVVARQHGSAAGRQFILVGCGVALLALGARIWRGLGGDGLRWHGRRVDLGRAGGVGGVVRGFAHDCSRFRWFRVKNRAAGCRRGQLPSWIAHMKTRATAQIRTARNVM